MRSIFLLLLFGLALASYNQSLGRTFSQLTISSYCKLDDIRSWTCDPCKRNPDIKNIHVWKNSTNDTVGFIATKDDLDAVFLVFRGTLPWDYHNWIEDINFIKTSYQLCDNQCQVHRGFYRAYTDIQNQVLVSLEMYMKLYNKTNIYITGHSLGSALATHCAAHLMSLNYTIKQFYTLGGPRVGDSKFKDWFNGKFGNRFKGRITHFKDPVPHLPYELWGFKHISTQIFYDSDFKFYTVCNESGEDDNCANQYVIFNNTDHLRYYGYDYWKEGLACFWKQ